MKCRTGIYIGRGYRQLFDHIFCSIPDNYNKFWLTLKKFKGNPIKESISLSDPPWKTKLTNCDHTDDGNGVSQ
jgi:hypothetical protein